MTTHDEFSGAVPRVDLLDITREPTDAELAALMHAAGDSARAIVAGNKVRVAQRLAQAIRDLDAQLGLKLRMLIV
jgi:hypothetical protein